MISNKQLWQSIYHIIKYSGYELAYINEEESDVILQHKTKKELIRFISDKQNVQSLNFLIDKMKDNLDVFNQQLAFIPQKIRLVLINQELPSGAEDRLVKVTAAQSQEDLDALDISMFYHMKTSYFKAKPQSVNTYRSRLLKTDFINQAMVKFAPLTFALIFINIVVFILTIIWGRSSTGDGLIDHGGLTHFNFVHGDYFRVITSIFLHFNVTHLLFNMMSLYIFGRLIEYLYGSYRFLLIYFTAGIFGNLISLSFDTSSISAGASGGISGLLGALVAYIIFNGKFNRSFVRQTIIGAILFLLISNLFAEVNNYAHFGGLFSGFLAALIITVYRLNRRYFYLAATGTAVLTILLLITIFSQQEQHIYNMKAEQLIEQGNFEKAESILQDTMANGYEDDQTYILSGLVKANNSSLTDAVAVWKKGLKEFPDSPSLNYQMALARRAQDDYPGAKNYLNKAMKLSDNPAYRQLDQEIKVFDN
ncbi:rhomboid family intramembrane serine protease [Macrococcus equipercicus]|uniref:Rhomboid family intramembrane serine protease n=1 Tax=Macrococcus equipercicus TaxID=69967 RepID=A0A9Q9BS70_9STAP|nr:rhomboid family intramembrane serine protease [Macrococcus equipercicus]UTH12951.1 rhomboid family intramembrane serine protease [Macrococcus equipercicus]